MVAPTAQIPLLGKVRLTSTLLVETGLHIGGGGENLDIGGLDKSVIRDPLTKYPYLPGSSIKGKLRSILERLLNEPINRPGGSNTYRHECDSQEAWYLVVGEGEARQMQPHVGARDCPICRMFGSTGVDCFLQTDQGRTKAKGTNKPARLLVRDCHLQDDSAKRLRNIDTGLYMTEWKFENGLDRITAAANPRQLERVPAGSEFNFELVYTLEDATQAQEDLRNLAIALAILEDDALGGHGSRGYGKVSFKHFELSYRDIAQYRQVASGSGDGFTPMALDNTADLLNRFGEIQALLPASGAST